MKTVIELLNKLLPDYGLTVIIATTIAFFLVIPVKILNRRNKAKKEKVAPMEAEIRKKYGINALGASVTEDISPSDEQIIQMEAKDREQKAAEEIDRLHRDSGYHAFIGALPGILDIVFVIMLYSGITAACPAGVYATKAFARFWQFDCGLKISLVYASYYAINVFTSLFSLLKHRKEPKKIFMITLISTALAIAFVTYLSVVMIPALLVGVSTIRVLTGIEDLVFNSVKKSKE